MMTSIDRNILCCFVAGLLLRATAASGTVYSATVDNGSTSVPKLNPAGNAWDPFSNAQGVPGASKSIKLLYTGDDLSAAGFPLNPASATVTLRPRTTGTPLNCVFSVSAPVLTASNAGTCTFRMTSTAGNVGDTLEIFYLGLLAGNIKYTATGLTPTIGTDSVTAFDSDSALSGTAPSPSTGPPLSRKPARLVLVFDKSGSMAWSAKPSDSTCGTLTSPIAACERWGILKSAAAQMVSVAKAYALPGDQLGVVFFDSVATDTGGIAAMTTTTLDAVNGALTTRSPGGSTSIGAGVEQLKAGQLASNGDFNNMTLVFTDGEQNTKPFLVSDGTNLLINATQNQPFGTAWVPTGNSIGLCTFRLRSDDPAGPSGTTTLQQIADRGCGGLMNSAATLNPSAATNLIAYFLLVLNKTLIGDKLELMHTDTGTQPMAGPPLQLQFTTSRRDLSFTVLLGWDHLFQVEGRPALKLSKDGVDFDVLNDSNVLVNGGNSHLALTLRSPFCNAAGKCVAADGTWTLQVTRTLPRGDGTWTLFVVGDNATLASDFNVTQATPGIGQPLQLKATLAEGGSPLAGLGAGSVKAFVQAPSQGLGNVLSASAIKPGEALPDPLSAAGLKVQAMLADPTERAKILAALELGAEQGIPLAETSPGVYTASFPATLVEGIYRVSFRVAGTSAGNGAFTRVFNTDRYVPVQPDDAATAATMQIAAFTPCDPRFAGGCKQITLRPVDASGNLVGPGKATSFGFKGSGSEVVGDVADKLNGSYTIVVGYTQPNTAAPPLIIGGLPLNLPPAAGSGGGVTPLAGWWWILLLILLAIILLVWLLRRP